MRAILAAIVILCAIAHPAGAQVIAGIARVIDGDSVEIGGVSIRLHGVDAPELDQTCERAGQVYACGRESADHLQRVVDGHAVRCVQLDRDRRGRPVSRCTAGAVDLSAAQVEAGMALAYKRFSVDYVPQEDRARVARAGMWAGPHVAPWDWRAAKRPQP